MLLAEACSHQMDEDTKKHRIGIRKLIVFLLVILALSVLIEASVSFYVLKSDINEAGEMFLGQIENVLESNKSEEEEQLEELKETYTVAAEAAAYIITDNAGLEYNTEELKNVASLLSVDELNIFDASGEIVGGTNPEYFGLTFDSGEQMAYFKPMLSDKTLNMCQDVTPNTAEGKNMLYAITWAKTGKFMVQVGVEPIRFTDMLEEHEIENVVNEMPLTEGYDIYVIDPESGIIVAASDSNLVNTSVSETTRESIAGKTSGIEKNVARRNGKTYFIAAEMIGDYYISVTYDMGCGNRIISSSIWVIFVFLLLAGIMIVAIVRKSYETEDKKNDAIIRQYRTLASMADTFYSMHLINLENDTLVDYKSQGQVRELSHNQSTQATALMRKVIENVVSSESVEDALKFTDLSTLADRMGKRKVVTAEFHGKNIGWFLASFIVTEQDENERPARVIFTTQSIDESKKREENLIIQSETDELTECYNRRAYEDALKELEVKEIPAEFVYISVDVDGLKTANDTLGHAAGDELIVGAGKCLKSSFSQYGKIFRTGGDEFVVLLTINQRQLKKVLATFHDLTEAWHGEIADHLSVSIGYALKAKNPTCSIQELAIKADKGMYEAKSLHYRMQGMDRRGQQDAHKALCETYAKILRINLTEDSYQIVNMNDSEQIAECGFADTLSEWLSSFGKTGQVHPDDLDKYLETTDLRYIKGYFAGGKTSLHLFYRRKIGDEYKQVMLEIIPADDYSPDNQSMFLYVKDIDK